MRARLTPYFAENSVLLATGRNIVNYDIYHLNSAMQQRLDIRQFVNGSNINASQFVSNLKDSAEKIIPSLQQDRHKSEERVALYQALANRYFPQTQSDRRTINITFQVSPYIGQDWDWHEYCRTWDAHKLLADSGIEAEELKRQYERLFNQAQLLTRSRSGIT